jgi:CRISPR/Cas system-associated exonuclease Cas4 (RecB family)
MKTFLQYVAEDLIRKYGTNLSRTAVVFPNKRAALFLNEHLARLAGQPIWSPATITISEMFRHHCDLQVADPIKQVCDLHHCFTEVTGFDETLDHFYSWGQLLLADFDDIDKNMADADQVFANLRDIHELDDVSYLSDEQKKIIQQFFSNFSEDHNTELKKRFLQLWTRMGDIYHTFNDYLAEQGLAYEGALYRKVAEQEDIDFEYDRYIFVGFNLLQRVEQRLFKMLKQQQRAFFYWDFDHYYMPSQQKGNSNNEAGYYIAQYLADFPNELDIHDDDIYNQFQQKREITYISAPTENAQARYISTWLNERAEHCQNPRTAIVLCNEGLLQTVIHCLPDGVEKVNITTGFPLIQSPIASLVSQMLMLQTTGYSALRERFRQTQANAVLSHPYVKYLPEGEERTLLLKHFDDNKSLLSWLCEVMQLIATGIEQTSASDSELPLMQESVFRMFTLLNRLYGLVESGELSVDIITLQRLINQLVSSASIPFHGEPVEGMQVMGVLETRNLDFDRLLILSCNEGNMPKGVNDTSFIPYSIRKAYGLTTIDHKVAIYSYYFHRLLQRAGDITIVYNNATSDGHTSEKSRFMLQLMVESQHEFRFQTLQAGQHFTPFQPQPVKKTDEIMQRLLNRFSLSHQKNRDASIYPLMTPTAINRYMRCPLSFYYIYACGIREADETEDDVIDGRLFGNIFHQAAQTLYEKMMEKSKTIQKSDIEALLKSKVAIEQAVDTALKAELFHVSADTPLEGKYELNGLQIINRQVIIHYLRRLLELDHRTAPFTMIGLEQSVLARIDTPYLTTTIGGRIDRLDQVCDKDPETQKPVERIRIVDYKTGSSRLTPLNDVEAVFKQENLSKHSDYYLQTLLYSCIVRTSKEYNPQQLPASPALLFIQHAGASDYDPTLSFGKNRINDVEDYRAPFGQQLTETVSDMFNPDIDFTPTEDRQRCSSCPYQLLCKLTLTLLICLSTIFSYAKHTVLSPNIKSLQVVANTKWTSMPIMTLGADDVLHIAFDELSHDYHRYVAHLEHCEADWTPSTDIFDTDWLEGFNDIPIDDYEKSINTTVLFTHYQYTIPNSQCRLRMSGNYRLHILDEDNGNEEVLVAEFRVVEPIVDVGLGVTTNTDWGLNGRFQQVSMTVNYKGLRVTRPDEEFHIVLMQNAREDNMKENVKPNYLTPQGMKWEHNRSLIYEAGNEYHKFEVLDPSHITMGLERVWWDESERYYHAVPFLCEPQRNYLYTEDANGAFYIRNSNNIENDLASDYVYVHYKLMPADEYADAQVFIDGKWTTGNPQDYQMYYDSSDRSYNATILQKMGYYNYQLMMMDADGNTHLLPEEGSFYQTENTYQALVYYKATSDRSWRLVGYREITFNAD